MRKANYRTMHQALLGLLGDLEILAGTVMPAEGVDMRDVIGTAKTNAAVLASQLEQAYNGNTEAFLVFPSPVEVLETLENESADSYARVVCSNTSGSPASDNDGNDPSRAY